ncbi:PAS domain S-box protein [Sphingomicrobium clamense]|uniref:histidine kinase n=1 Tax=Sphingomicrobium clamense TaxID=2851013 RepID=A0ABS6V3U4_9SPHN|nr:PAS domain S-box protein [Sphingomicrobium sp. B8]MBW0143872.1 PAS domain S-box protein [Sphingomicrobium sp. B8]
MSKPWLPYLALADDKGVAPEESRDGHESASGEEWRADAGQASMPGPDGGVHGTGGRWARFLPRTPFAWMMALGIGTTFFLLAYFGILLTRESGRIAAVWLANGIAVAIILRNPRAHWPLLFASVFAGNLMANFLHADPVARAMALACANLIEIGIITLMMRGALRPDQSFESGPVIGRFMASALVAALVAGLFAASALTLLENGQFLAVAQHWFVADALGLLITAPLLLSLPPRLAEWVQPRAARSLARRFETGALVTAVVATTLVLFLQERAPLIFLLGPLLVLSAFRLSLAMACFTILASSAVAIVATGMGLGPMARFAGEEIMRIYALQSLIASMIALVLPVRALIVERDRMGVAMERTERKFLRIAEASLAGILHLDLNGEATWANNRWTEMTGQEFRRGKHRNWVEAIAPEARSELLTMWTKARATLEPVSGEFPAACEDRDCGWVALSIHPERSASGDLTGFVVRLSDVTERRAAEEKLADSERLYRLVTENVSDIVIRLGLDGSMLYVSAAAQRMLGHAPDDLVGRPIRDLIHGEDWKEFRSAFTDLLTGGRARPELRYRHRCADGTFRWVEGSFRPVFDAKSGEPIELVASIRDITRRRRTEQVVAESAAKLRESHRLISLAECLARTAHWRLDLNGGEFDYSPQANAICNVPRNEPFSARDALRLVAPEDRDTLLSTMARARRAERSCECEIKIKTPAGELRHLRVVIQADRTPEGKLDGLVGVLRDVTVEHHARDELVQARDTANAAARAKSHFLATMSHEIRTPMTGVLGMIDLLKANPDEGDRARYLDMLETSADLLMAVLDDILDFSKIDSGQVALERRDFVVDRLVEESAALFERQAAEKGIQLCFVHDGESATVRGDPMRLRQILANLLSNSIKFTEQGEIRLRLATQAAGDDTEVHIAVADSGIGIAQNKQDRLFEPFTQADASTSRRFGGTGLGLAICRRLVEAMGGQISVASAPGEGATFSVKLTLPTGSIENVDDPVEAYAALPDAPRREYPSLSILVAEDNPVNQMLISAMLRADGHRVAVVENGRLAVERAAREQYDAIVMDMQMPEMDGLAATRAIRGSDGPCAAIPIIALTADSSPDRRRFYDGAGLSAFLTKPIDQEILLDQIRAIAGLGSVDGRTKTGKAPPSDNAKNDDAERLPALFDNERLGELREAVGQKRLSEMFALLDAELATRPDEIAALVKAGDRDGALRLAHSLKGAAGSAGALAVAALAEQFEAKDV